MAPTLQNTFREPCNMLVLRKTHLTSNLSWMLWRRLYIFLDKVPRNSIQNNHILHFHCIVKDSDETCNFPFQLSHKDVDYSQFHTLHSTICCLRVNGTNISIHPKNLRVTQSESCRSIFQSRPWFQFLIHCAVQTRLILPLFSVGHVTSNSCITEIVIMAQNLTMTNLAFLSNVYAYLSVSI